MSRLTSSIKITGLLVMAGIAACVVVLDQLTKAWIVSSMVSHDVRVVIPGLVRLRYTENSGAAFGLFQGWTGILSVAAFAIITGIVLSASRMGSSNRFMLFSLGLVLGGAVGNLIDRVRLGYVVDFVEVYGPHVTIKGTQYTFPVFNVADSAITVGVILIMAGLIFAKQETPTQNTEAREGTELNVGT